VTKVASAAKVQLDFNKPIEQYVSIEVAVAALREDYNSRPAAGSPGQLASIQPV
jgi:hypothetical protein